MNYILIDFKKTSGCGTDILIAHSLSHLHHFISALLNNRFTSKSIFSRFNFADGKFFLIFAWIHFAGKYFRLYLADTK